MSIDIKTKANELSSFLKVLSAGAKNEFADLSRVKVIDSTELEYVIKPRQPVTYDSIVDYYIPRWGLLESVTLKLTIPKNPLSLTTTNDFSVIPLSGNGLIPVKGFPVHIIEYFDWTYGGKSVYKIPGDVVLWKYYKLDDYSKFKERASKMLGMDGVNDRTDRFLGSSAPNTQDFYVTVPSFFEKTDALEPIDTQALRQELVLRVKFRQAQFGFQLKRGSQTFTLNSSVDLGARIPLSNGDLICSYLSLADAAASQLRSQAMAGYSIKTWVPEIFTFEVQTTSQTSVDVDLRSGLRGHCQQLLVFIRNSSHRTSLVVSSSPSERERHEDYLQVSNFRINASGVDFYDFTENKLQLLDMEYINPRPRYDKFYVLDFQTHPRNVWLDEMQRLNGVMGSLFLDGMNNPRLFLTTGTASGDREVTLVNLKHYVIRIVNNDVVALTDI